MHVIGTAGHIDHGKSTLVKALTGIDPDRLQEEKDRGLSIDLGFAWIELPSGKVAGIVDVPGHHRFIRNMLAGAGGIDLALFVIDATEGWMQQSAEHLAILHLLGVSRGVVAVTKVDLARDDEWLDMVEEDVRERLADTALADAAVLRVSAVTGEGLPALQAHIDDLLATAPSPSDWNRPRLWIDRVFTVRGAGTVVTGRLEGGAVRLDQTLHIVPKGIEVRVRGLQSHGKATEQAFPGQRVAVNLAGADRSQVERGDALAVPGVEAPTRVVHVALRTLSTLQHPLRTSGHWTLHTGSAEVACRLILFQKTALRAGEEAYAQLTLRQPLLLRFGDRFVLREPARQETVGGGRVLDVHPLPVRGPSLRLARSESPEGVRTPARTLDLEHLRRRDEAEVEALPEVVIQQHGLVRRAALARQIPLAREDVESRLASFEDAGELVQLPSFVLTVALWNELTERLRDRLAQYHRTYPLRRGMPRETLRTQIGLSERLFEESVARLVDADQLRVDGAQLRLPDHTVTLSPNDEEQARRLIARLEEAPLTPPTLDQLRASGFQDELINALIEMGRLSKVAPQLVYLTAAVDQVKSGVADYIRAHGRIDVAALRDRLGTSRKYAVPLLEYLDQQEFTRRVGDARVLGAKGAEAGP